MTSDLELEAVLPVLVLTFAFGYVAWGVLHLLRRRRPDLTIGIPVTIGFGCRLAAALAVSLTPFADTLRGGDEEVFLSRAKELTDHGVFSAESLDAVTSAPHVWLFSLQMRMDFTE